MTSPIKSSFKTEWFSLALIILAFIAGTYFYQLFPDSVPTHWNLRGEANGFSRPWLAAFLLPIIMAGIYLLFTALPYLDPRREQYEKFAKVYHQFKDVIMAFLFATFIIASLKASGQNANISFIVPALVGLLFIFLGSIMNKIKSNWFFGIRTPWTLSSEAVWDKTHQAASRFFYPAGLLLAATALVPGFIKIVFLTAAILLIAFGLPLYSYLIYVQEKKNKK